MEQLSRLSKCTLGKPRMCVHAWRDRNFGLITRCNCRWKKKTYFAAKMRKILPGEKAASRDIKKIPNKNYSFVWLDSSCGIWECSHQQIPKFPYLLTEGEDILLQKQQHIRHDHAEKFSNIVVLFQTERAQLSLHRGENGEAKLNTRCMLLITLAA